MTVVVKGNFAYVQNPATVMCLFPTSLYLHLGLRAFHIPLTRAATRLILRLLNLLKEIGCHSNPLQLLLDARPCRSDVIDSGMTGLQPNICMY
jgi:hypothetical protein